MSLQPPNIDSRSYEDLVAQTEFWMQHYTGWQPQSTQANSQTDAGRALIRIFGRMAFQVVQRLNQAPDKNFLAFLNLLGTQLLPPQPARVPLTFSLVEGNTTGGFVPARTQVAATLEGKEVLFETERDLFLPASKLAAVMVCDPNRDRYANRTDAAIGIVDQSFDPFNLSSDDSLIEHSLYLACDPLFLLPGDKTITLIIRSLQAARLSTLPIEWSIWNGQRWQPIRPNLNARTTPPDPNQWEVMLALTDLQLFTLPNQADQGWIRARLTRPLPEVPEATDITIQRITARATVTQPPQSPARCLLNQATLDLSKDFFPFGTQPQFNDTLYFCLEPGAAQPGITLQIAIKLSQPLPHPVRPSSNLTLQWEIWTGDTWQALLTSREKTSPETFSADGPVSLTLPDTIAPISINGELHHWLRVRIIDGDYGRANAANLTLTTLREPTDNGQTRDRANLKVTDTRGFKPNDSVEIMAGTLAPAIRQITAIDLTQDILTINPALDQAYLTGTAILRSPTASLGAPSLQSLKVSYDYTLPARDLTTCLTYNDFEYRDCTAKNSAQAFQPFTPPNDRNPTLYLGFDAPFPNWAIALYAQVEPLRPEDLLIVRDQTTTRALPQLVWQYAASTGWSGLGATDETQSFAERGQIQFIAPADFALRSQFGRSLYWLRVTWQQGTFRVPPRLRRLGTQTAWATQATTLTNEILGSSTGNPAQSFTAAQHPVLLGQQLVVQEPSLASSIEQAQIRALEGDDAIALTQDAAGQLTEIWVRWHEVSDFYGSAPHDRHYVLDHYTGQIQFGNGQQGKIPPQGINNIRLRYYQTGGGSQGNCPARTITQLKTAVPYLDQVTNLEAAAGGIDQEALDRAKARGPKTLRHRGRATALQDFEDLAYEASPAVARAKAIAPYLLPGENDPRIEFLNPLDDHLWIPSGSTQPNLSLHNRVNAGELLVLIVPDSTDARPTPSLTLIDQVTDYLRDRASATLDLKVVAPIWRKVSITVEVVPVALENVEQTLLQIRDRLAKFLHPLVGGTGTGWEFGREPHDSDFYALIESVPNVDHVTTLNIVSTEIPNNISPDQVLVYSGTHTISFR